MRLTLSDVFPILDSEIYSFTDRSVSFSTFSRRVTRRPTAYVSPWPNVQQTGVPATGLRGLRESAVKFGTIFVAIRDPPTRASTPMASVVESRKIDRQKEQKQIITTDSVRFCSE